MTPAMKTPYGLWPSPISAQALSQRIRFDDVQWDGGGQALVWLEGRGDRGTLVMRTEGGALRDLTDLQSVRGGVGYGGGEFSAHQGTVFFAEKNGRLYRRSLEAGMPRAITPAFGKTAAPRVSPDGKWVVYVHTDEGRDALALVEAQGNGWPVRLVSGADFYMQPAWHPSGKRLAWIEWDHPNMPWDGVRLQMADFDPGTGRIGDAVQIAGGKDVPVNQPEFSPDGRWLSYVTEEGEWEQLILLDLDSGQKRVLVQGGTLAEPAWVQGRRSYGWTGDSRRIFYVRSDEGFASLWRTELDGTENRVDLGPYTWVRQPAVSPAGERVAFVASAPDHADRIVVWEAGELRVVRYSDPAMIGSEVLPEPQPVSWMAKEGGETARVYGLFYRPRNPGCQAAGQPPAILSIHGGPTSQRVASFDAERAYFTSRGYAWLDVNYRGSTGYGRAYRQALNGRWGDVDVVDTVAAAQALADQGLADGRRMVVRGGSSGGYTVLNALTRYPGKFKAGLCSYPVSNLFTINMETHKFEAHYNDSLVGVLPEAAEKFRAWSPVFHAGLIRDPVAIFQGSADVVVPPEQSESIVQVLRANGVPHIYRLYEGEGHGFRRTETLASYYQDTERFLQQYVIFAA